MKHSSSLAVLAARIGATATAGFGFGIGRDAWRSTKKNPGEIIILLVASLALALPYWGGRNLVRGYPPASVYRSLWRFAAAGSMVVLGAAIAIGIAFLALGFLSAATNPAEPIGLSVAILIGIVPVGCAFLIGLLVGGFQRGKRLKVFRIAQQNTDFLSRLGFTETGEAEVTHYDGDGNALRLLEQGRERLVFMVVGKRNLRAYIDLSADGEMLDYSGPITLSGRSRNAA